MAKTTVISTRLAPEQEQRLSRKAAQLGRSPSETSALLIEEGLRRDEFAFIDFRASPAGRQAYIQGSTLAVWEIVWIARGYRNSVEKAAAHLKMSPLRVRAALNYGRAHAGEIEQAIADNEAANMLTLSRMLPQIEAFSVRRAK